MKNKLRFLPSRGAFAGLLGLVLAPVLLPAQSTTYTLTDLGTLPGGVEQYVTPSGLNNQAQASGTSGPALFALRFTDGLVQNLGVLPGGDKSYGNGINNLGEVVGSSTFKNGGSILHAALFRNGTVVDIGTLPDLGSYGQAQGINDSSVVVGYSGASKDTTSSYPFIWDATNGIRRVGTFNDGFGKAYSINNSGQITGTSAFNLSTHAFISDDAVTIRDIGVLGGNTSTGRFINANGHVVGNSTIASDNRQHAFLYDGVMHDLGSLGNDFVSDFSYAYGVNIDDTVVGSTNLPYHGGALVAVAFVYVGGKMYDLNTLVDSSGADYYLGLAKAINDQGQILVNAVQLSTNSQRAVLLTPNGGATTDTVTITRANYTSRTQQLTVQATDSNPTATLTAYITATDTVLGPLRKKGSAYTGKFTVATKPASITVKSSLGGTATAVVTGR